MRTLPLPPGRLPPHRHKKAANNHRYDRSTIDAPFSIPGRKSSSHICHPHDRRGWGQGSLSWVNPCRTLVLRNRLLEQRAESKE